MKKSLQRFPIMFLLLSSGCVDPPNYESVLAQLPLANNGETPASGGTTGTVPINLTSNVLYVSSQGESEGADGSLNHPFTTIQKCLSVAKKGVTCMIRAGVYPEMLVPPVDGVNLVAYPGEDVTVTTADSVSNWQEVSSGVYSAKLTLSNPQQLPGYQFFWKNGNSYVAVPQAQWPPPPSNGDFMLRQWAVIQNATQETGTNSAGNVVPIPATLTDPKLPLFTPENVTIHLWSGSDPYAQYAGTVQSSEKGSLKYIADGIFETNTAIPGGFYYLVGAKEFLTENSWYYDSEAGELYWYVPQGVDPKSADVRFQTRVGVMDLSGRSSIVVKGIQFVGGGITMDSGSSNNTLDELVMTYLANRLHPHMLMPTVGQDSHALGVHLAGQGNTLKNSQIMYSNLSAITVEGQNQTIENNLIHDVDSFGNVAAGIEIGPFSNGTAPVANILIKNNTIYRAGRSAIHLFLNGSSNYSNIEISFNEIFQTMLLSADGGAIYACCRTLVSNGSVHDNLIHDVGIGSPSMSASNYPGPATQFPISSVYWDNGSGGVDISNNYLWNATIHVFINHDNQQYSEPLSSVFASQNIHISSNTIPDPNHCSIEFNKIWKAENLAAYNNKIVYPLIENSLGSGVSIEQSNNSSTPSGASITAPVGCQFSGCPAAAQVPAFPKANYTQCQ